MKLKAATPGFVLIAADNTLLNSDAFYSSNTNEIREPVQRHEPERKMVKNSLQKTPYQFNWEKAIDKYEEFI